MTTAAQWRKLALALPEAEEKAHFEQPDFRVRNKIFAGLSREGDVGNLKLTPELQAMLLGSHPDAFYPATGAWGRAGWTHVRLAKAKVAAVRELLPEAWRLVAPKRLVAEYDRRAKA
jgi:hypothetical protein